MNCRCFNPTPYPFPMAACDSPGYPVPSGPEFCRPHFPALRENFTVPAAGSDVTIKLTDTQSLTVGQGFLLGSTFYQIRDIVDSLTIVARHNGVGAEEGALIVAVHPVYGCYQYPIVPYGGVTITSSPSLAGLEVDGETAIGSGVTAATVQAMVHSYTGPTSIQFSAEAVATLAGTPAWVAIALPIPRETDAPQMAFAAFLDDGAGPVPAVGKFGVGDYANYVLVGKGGGNLFGNGADKQVVVSGSYELLI